MGRVKRPVWPKGLFHWDVPLYGGTVWLACTRVKYAAAAAVLDGEPASDNSIGCMLQATHPDHGRVFLIGVFNGTQHVLAHEIGHACLDIMEVAGIDPIGCGGEPYCYLQQSMFEALSTKVKPPRRKRSRTGRGPGIIPMGGRLPGELGKGKVGAFPGCP